MGGNDRVAITQHHDEWWAECLICGAWVSTKNPTRRAAEEKFGRHFQHEHHPQHETGTAPGRKWERVPRDDANRSLSELAGKEIQLGDGLVMSSAPSTCPACGGGPIEWAITTTEAEPDKTHHPLIWDHDSWLADSYICTTCSAGWIETDSLDDPINWVRPWWTPDTQPPASD